MALRKRTVKAPVAKPVAKKPEKVTRLVAARNLDKMKAKGYKVVKEVNELTLMEK